MSFQMKLIFHNSIKKDNVILNGALEYTDCFSAEG